MLWTEHRAAPLPGGRSKDPHLHEIALYDAWLTPIVEAALANDGRLARGHADLLEQRRAEGNQPLWAAGGAVGETAKAYLVRLLAIEDLLSGLPLES